MITAKVKKKMFVGVILLLLKILIVVQGQVIELIHNSGVTISAIAGELGGGTNPAYLLGNMIDGDLDTGFW